MSSYDRRKLEKLFGLPLFPSDRSELRKLKKFLLAHPQLPFWAAFWILTQLGFVSPAAKIALFLLENPQARKEIMEFLR